jgi:hypothetical protein
MIKVLYIGIDDGYFQNLEKHFCRIFPDQEFEFVKLWHDEANTFQSIVVKIVKEVPNIAFLDYSASPLKMLTLARSLPRILNRGASVIGLWDYLLGTPLLIKESNTTGIPFNHIKSGEFSDIVIQSMFLLKTEEGFPRDHFSKVEFNESAEYSEASHAMRIGFVTNKYIHVEHDLLLPEGKSFTLSGEFKTKLPVKKYKVIRRLDENYYYNFSYVSDIEFVTEVKVEAKPEETKKEKSWRLSEMQDRSNQLEKNVANFVKNCDSVNIAKRTRVLVIDSDLDILSQADRPIDSYQHSIRFFRHLSDDAAMLIKIRAGIICFTARPEEESEGDGEETEGKEIKSINDVHEDELGKIISSVKALGNYSPFIMVFKSAISSEDIKKQYNYDRIMSDGGDFSLSQLLDVADLYTEKGGREKANDGKDSYHDQEERIYLDKNSEESYLNYNFNILIRELSESWVSFQTLTQLPLWGIFSLKDPVSMCITVVEKLDEKEWCQDGYHQYLAVIHGIGEVDKATLRRQVNQIIYNQAQEIKDAEEAQKTLEADAAKAAKKEQEDLETKENEKKVEDDKDEDKEKS